MNVLITGATSGLGLELKRSFESRGDFFIGTTVEPAFTANSNILFWDAMHPNQTERLVTHLVWTETKFDVVINNAGINAIKPFGDLTEGFLHDVMQVNCIAPVMLIKHLLAGGILARGARVCNVISDAAWRPMRHSLAYNISKAALDMATKQMARELTKPHDITVFGVRPGKMHSTGMSNYIDKQVCALRGWTPEQASDYFKQSSVTGIEADPKHVAELIYSLCTTSVPISGACLDLAG